MSDLPHLLARAWIDRGTVAIPETLVPADADAAYVAQYGLLGAIEDHAGGWKLGARSADGSIQGAPLPARGIYGGGAVLKCSDFPVLGLELEIAFSFGRAFNVADAALSDGEIMASVQSMRTSIEIVASRVAGWPQVPQLVQLADLQNHGALVVGEPIDYAETFPFVSPAAHFSIGGKILFEGQGNNPAGDPRRLLPWVVRHCIARQLPLPAGSVLTTGTYVGAHFSTGAGLVKGEIDGLPVLQFTLE
jgi:2-keto-4-pentenoate hydratase